MGLLDQNPFAPPPVPAPLSADEERWLRVLAALDQLAAALRDRPEPAPVVVEAPKVDLTDVVMAVQALKGPATAEEIALALRAVLRPDEPVADGTAVVLEKLAEKLEALDFRLKGVGRSSTGGGFASMTVNGSPVSNNNPMPVTTSTATTGTWGYTSGTVGTATLTGNKRVTRITAVALGAAGSFTINGGDTITLPYDSTDNASSSITIEPAGVLVDPEIVFTGTDGYVIEHTS